MKNRKRGECSTGSTNRILDRFVRVSLKPGTFLAGQGCDTHIKLDADPCAPGARGVLAEDTCIEINRIAEGKVTSS